MSPELWEKVASVFEAALCRESGDVATFLDEACHGDAELRSEVEKLLAADVNAAEEGFLSIPDFPETARLGHEGEPGATLTKDAASPFVCGSCRSPITLMDRLGVDDVVCPACGSSVREGGGDAVSVGSVGVGKSVGRFRVIGRVGSGAFGVVYQAFDPKLDRVVALKLMRAGDLASGPELERFHREARNAARLKHPSVVAVHEVGEHQGSPFLVSDFIEGATLADRLVAGRPSAREAAQLVAAIADALDYAHRHGVVHRDVKPANVIIDPSDVPHLVDFGLAKREAADATITADGAAMGTPAYMSPEQARGDVHNVDGRSDVYSAGVVLYELLTGERPFRGNQRRLIEQVLKDEPPAPRKLNDRVPKDLETVCLKAMAKEPSRRYATAGDFAEELRRFLSGHPVLARRAGAVEVAWRWCRRNPAVAGGLTAAAAGLMVAAVALALYLVLSFKMDLRKRQEVEEVVKGVGDFHREWLETRFLPAQQGERARKKANNEITRLRNDLSGIEPAWLGESRGRAMAEELEEVQREVHDDEDFHTLLDSLGRTQIAREELGPAGSSARYLAALKEYRVDPGKPSAPADLSKRLEDRPQDDRSSLADAIEAWAIVENDRDPASKLCRAAIALADAADPEPVHRKIREAWLNDQDDVMNQLTHDVELAQLRPGQILMIASRLEATEKRADAIALLQTALRHYPHAIWLNYRLAELLARHHPDDLDQAIPFYRVARAIKPSTGHELAHLLDRTGRDLEAEAVFRELAALVPDDPQHPICLGAFLEDHGRGDEAKELLKTAVASARIAVADRPDDPTAHLALGNALAATKTNDDEAGREYRRTLEISKDSHFAHAGLAELANRAERLEEAAQEYQTYLQAEKEDNRSRRQYAATLVKLGRIDEARAQFQQTKPLPDDPVPVPTEFADFLRQRWQSRRDDPSSDGLRDEAIALYREGLQLQPDDASSRSNLGDLYRHRGDDVEAIAEFRKALESRDSAAGRLDLAEVLSREERYGESVDEYRAALAKEDSAGGRASLGQTLLLAGRYDEAAAEYERALALVLAETDQARALRGDRDFALSLRDLSRRLPDVLANRDKPVGLDDATWLARMAFALGKFAESTELWEQAFAENRDLLGDPATGNRFMALRAAAASGKAVAPEWLDAELSAYQALADHNGPGDRALVRRRLNFLARDRAMAEIRANEALWNRAEALRSRLANPFIH